MSEEEFTFTLTFKVPEIDFDAGQLEAALLWIRSKVQAATSQADEISGINTYNLLNVIHDRYMDALGEPSWKMPALARTL